MLQTLRIRNFVLIDALELEFEGAFNVITGETGAGKSIILDAVALILGGRSNADVIRAGCDEAVVEALFDISSNPAAQAKLESRGIPTEGGDLVVKRVIQRSGKNRIFVNGELVTLAQLGDLAENLVDLCSQHEHQSLARPAYQLDLIDRFGGLQDLKRKVRESHSALRSKAAELAQLSGDAGDRARLEDFLRFQIQEIEAFAPKEGEEEALGAEHKRLMSVTHLLEASGSAEGMLAGDGEADAASLVAKALKRLAKAAESDPRLTAAVETLQRAQLELEEATGFLRNYASELQPDPARVEQIEERLTRLSALKKKYGADAAGILGTLQRLEAELADLLGKGERAAALEEEITAFRAEYLAGAKQLSKKRKAITRALADSIRGELEELKMAGTTFEARLSAVSEDDEGAWSPEGLDRVEFLFAPNVGETPKPLGKIASGGEMSRVMLAIRRIISDKGGICVYLFDEIDAGIGGLTASVVGKKIRSVAKDNQVICITHLAQIAAFADAHFSVEKKAAGGRTVSRIERVKGPERVDEVARMLGGTQVTAKSREHAKELLKQGGVASH